MTEAEKRQAGLQARSDMLEKARMEQEMQQAQADRAALGLGFQANSGVELQGLRDAGDMTAADIQNAAAMDRTMAQNSAELQRAQISAATQRYTAQLNASVQRADLAWRQRVDGLNRSDAEKARIGEGFGTITARVAAAFKVTDNPANAAMAANAWRADAKSFAARNGLPAEYASDQFNPFAEAAKAVSPSATAKGAMTREEFAKQYTAGPGGARAAADQSPQD
jgi:hypothetical protein